MESFTMVVINWKGLLLRGVLAIILGLIMVLLPGPTLIVAVLLIGVFVMMLGLVALVMFLALKDKGKSLVLLIEGIIGITFGLITIVWPNITALLLILILGVWCLIEGVVQVFAGLTMKWRTGVRLVVGASGVLSVIIGLIFVLVPGDGALALIWLIGVFAIAYGVLSIIYGLLARSMHIVQRRS